MDKRILTHGTLAPLPNAVQLRAGRLTMLYESGFIRYIRNGSNEIIRIINHYMRDHNWNTIPMEIQSEQINIADDSFEIRYTATIRRSNIDFSWSCTIMGHSDETISFSIDGQANSEFQRNRLGFTVLLPTENLRGQTCRITDPEGLTHESLFPDAISPHQPFLNIQSMAWSPSSGLQATMTFSGDVFEMEDQRNWMDASHKVYCTPLAHGFPKTVKPGERISQAIHIKVFGDLHEQPKRADAVTFSIDSFKGSKLPRIGIPLSDIAMNDMQTDLIRRLSPDFVSVVIKRMEDLARIPAALKLSRPLEIVLFPEIVTIEEVAPVLKSYAQSISHIVILVEGKRAADRPFVDRYVPILRKHLPKVTLGSGTDAFFTELNRNPTPAQSLDFLSFSVNPQTHASDLRTMTENLVAHRDVVESCRLLSGGRGVRVGPVTLKMRWNPDATSKEEVTPLTLPSNVDSRQLSLYAAGWTLGSLKYLTEAGADIVTYYEAVGWRGLVSHQEQPWPQAYGLDHDQVYPVYLMLRLLMLQSTSTVLPLHSTDPLAMDGMAFRMDGKRLVILANYTADELSVVMPQGFEPTGIQVVGGENVGELLTRPHDFPMTTDFHDSRFPIPPFGFVVLEGKE